MENDEVEVHLIQGHDDIANSVLIVNGNKSIVVDCGSETMSKRILSRMEKNGIGPSDISLIVVSHVHYDHVRGLKILKNQLPNAKVLVHKEELSDFKGGKCRIPKGTNFFTGLVSVLGNAFSLIAYKFTHFDTVPFDCVVVMEDEKMKIDGVEIIHTPGHSKGSVCVISDGFCCIGDSIESFDGKECYPTFADDVKELLRSWKKICEIECVKYLLPSHGIKTKKSALEKEFKKYSKKMKK